MTLNPTAAAHATRAAAVFEALQKALFDSRSGLYYQPQRRFLRLYEPLWPFVNAWAATCALAGIPGQKDNADRQGDELLSGQIPAVLRYLLPHRPREDEGVLEFSSTIYRPLWSRLASRFGKAGTSYYDDNAWLALVLLQQFRLTGEHRCVDFAEKIFAFVTSGWCDDTSLTHPGGIRWANAPWSLSRNTCSNGPAAEVGAELYLLTGTARYLDWALQIYEWTHSALQREDGLFSDAIQPDGEIEPAVLSYNQGSMIGAGAMLYEATADKRYLDDSRTTAAASLERYRNLALLVRELPAFVAIYLRNVFLLDTMWPDPQYRALGESYASAMWEQRHDPESGLFLPLSAGVNGTAPLVAIEALLAGGPPRP